jgi:hypothetical protein
MVSDLFSYLPDTFSTPPALASIRTFETYSHQTSHRATQAKAAWNPLVDTWHPGPQAWVHPQGELNANRITEAEPSSPAALFLPSPTDCRSPR